MSPGNRRCWVLKASVLVGVLALAYLLLAHGPHASFWPKCLFHKYTGLHCAGCGMTRAVHCILKGDLMMAFRYNPLVLSLLVIALLAMIWELLARWTGKDLPLRLRPSLGMLWALVGLFLLYWVLRNVPVWPFTLLAPP